jgi:hypothetical protein
MDYLQRAPPLGQAHRVRCGVCTRIVVWRNNALVWLSRKERRALKAVGVEWKDVTLSGNGL